MFPQPIGVFDSGVGGLTVVEKLIQEVPGIDIIYFGDTAHVPYGPRSAEQLRQFADEMTSFLFRQGAMLVIDACNSTSSVALDFLRAKYGCVFGVVEPGVREAVRLTRNKRIGLIATEATVNSNAHRLLAASFDPEVQFFAQACPKFVPFVEAGIFNGTEVLSTAEDYLCSLKREGIDTLILGCTHYPYLVPVIRKVIGDGVMLVDPAAETAREIRRYLYANNLLEARREKQSRFHFFVSGDPLAFRNNLKRLFKYENPTTITPVRWVKDELTGTERLLGQGE